MPFSIDHHHHHLNFFFNDLLSRSHYSLSKCIFMCVSLCLKVHTVYVSCSYSPVYVYPHSKAVLMRAIQEDTQFLAQNAIMDYSLLTCIDDQTGELVVGIIGGCVCVCVCGL